MAMPGRTTVRLMPAHMRFVNGVSRAYDDEFPHELRHLVDETQFSHAINQINNTLTDYWPCLFCVCYGYACCVCTGGLSLLCPHMCISDAEQYARTLIDRINHRPCFQDVGVEWKFVKRCGRSWIEISFPTTNYSKKGDGGTYQKVLIASPTSSSRTTDEASPTLL
ncbi:hypothetical protein SDRG_05356 [Saprolegnia diclina VS20]|uniref:Golgin subfamily A member 7/ERF4 domain-containing protein n=1 Tax=Saprolegnia diclina (strain VS20) TaxID=1156394 RepID=T0QGN2_SAPDV|nr:hypothetical protein SDRG_05356 [Saprolegnia diclina VS20]EQC37129.1 hypothetical protein SDRG_05356 [Saprolegnia diclina VS20]|eukprot:XP_008609291.1 hypothetical protein SDRG_05356 [Saprolegnia diclina VS20]